MDLVTGTDGVSTPEPYVVGSGSLRVVAYDFGVKSTTLRCLSEFATVTVVPADTPASDAMALEPDGIFLSNGPGDPAALEVQASIVSDLIGRVADLRHLPRPPASCVCARSDDLQARRSATTAGTIRSVSFDTGRVEITAQNHNYAVSAPSLDGIAEITHVNLNDGVVEGIRAVVRAGVRGAVPPRSRAGAS